MRKIFTVFLTSSAIGLHTFIAHGADMSPNRLETLYDIIKAAGWGENTDNEERLSLFKQVQDLINQDTQTIDELQQNADAMRAKEQSTANKLLGGATMGATGIGGMQLASALSEQQSDEDAERAMRAYLATFHCNYGSGKNVQGGEKDIELPGGNELIGLYSEYVNLANDLKVRKNALGMKPGIESESILDSATSGLYDDVSIGKTSGAFTSLARALQEPNGADAAAWAEQKSTSEKKLKTGATIAGIGAVGGAVGNLLINKNAPQEKSKEINQKYEKLKKIIVDTQPKIDAIPNKKCSEFNGTNSIGDAPNCTCNDDDARFFPDQGGCIKCDAGMEYNNSNECVKPGCTLTGAIDAEKCACVTNATKNDNNKCECINGYEQVNGTCTQQQTLTTPSDKPQPQVLANLEIKADTTFASSSAEITTDAQEVFKDSLVSELQKISDLSKIDQYCIYITGHTDRTRFKSTSKMNNKLLSEQRAAAIAKIFTDAGIPENNIKNEGMADRDCTKDRYPQQNDPKCRRVDVQIVSDTCDNTNPLSQITNNIKLDNLISGFTKN